MDGRCGLYCDGQNPARPGQRSCTACHARWMRENRPKWNQESPEARKKRNARNYARVYVSRGKLVPTPCPCGCGSSKLEMHHEDYDKPLEVVFCCRDEHRRRDAARFARLRDSPQLVAASV